MLSTHILITTGLVGRLGGRKMVDEQVDEQNDRDRDAVDALLDGLHAPVTPQPTPERGLR